MSAHSCNDLCDKDERFHRIQKQQHEALLLSHGEMREYLIKRYFELHPACDHNTSTTHYECKGIKELLVLLQS